MKVVIAEVAKRLDFPSVLGALGLQKLGLFDLIQPAHVLADHTEALRQALGQVKFTGLITG